MAGKLRTLKGNAIVSLNDHPDIRRAFDGYLRRLWHVYGEMIEFIHGVQMDGEKERESIEALGMVAHEMDVQLKLTGDRALAHKLRSVLTPGTSEADRFEKGYRAHQPSAAAP